jgi:hypothetical protein
LPEKSRTVVFVGRSLLLLGIVAPYLLCWLYVHNYGIDTPLSDDFTIVLAMKLCHDGQFGLPDLLSAQHNEHREALPYALMLGLARLTHYNTLANMYAGLVFLGATLMLTIVFLWPRLKRATVPAYALIPVAWTICSVRQTQNLLMSFQGAYESLFFFLLSLFLLDGVKSLGVRFWGGGASALLSAFSFGNGLLSLPIGGLLLATRFYLESPSVFFKRAHILAVWITLSALIVAAYFWHFFPGVGQGKVTIDYLIHAPEKVIEFALGFLACPIAREVNSAIFFGLAFCLLSLVCAVALLRKRDALKLDLVLPAMLIVYALLSACMAAYGRAQLGMEASFVSRYATMANWGWIGLYVLVLLSTGLNARFRRLLTACILLCLAIGAVTTALYARLDGLLIRDVELNVEETVRSYASQGPQSLEYWTGVAKPDVVPLIQFMEEERLSLFSRPGPNLTGCLESKAPHVPYWTAIENLNGRIIEGSDKAPTISLDQSEETDLIIKGWCADLENRKLPRAVFVLIGDRMIIPAACGLVRIALSQGPGREFLITSGLSASCRLDMIAKGEHDVSMKILASDGHVCFTGPVLLHLKIK